jgi:hypothetical protein
LSEISNEEIDGFFEKNIEIDELEDDEIEESLEEESSSDASSESNSVPNETGSSFDFGDLGNIQFSYYAARLEELKKYEKNLKAETTAFSVTSTPKSIQAADLIQTKDRVKKTILFVATFLPRLSNQDFAFTVSLLLENKPASNSTSPPTPEPMEANSDKEPPETPQKDPYTLWQEAAVNSDRIMQECHLKSVLSDSATRVVDFELSYLRPDLKIYFNERAFLYLEEQFNRAKLLLLAPSIGLARNAIELSVEMANADPIHHGRQWLSDLLNLFRLSRNFLQLREYGFNSFEAVQLLIQSKQEQEEFELFVRFLSQIDEQYHGDFLISRVAFLIARMLDHLTLRACVDGFLQQEISTQNQETVLALTALLHNVTTFDWLSWIERLLNEKDALISSYTRQILLTQLEESEEQIYAIFQRIRSWLPDDLRSRRDYSQTQVYALRFIYKYSRELALDLDASDYGCHPSKYQLFAYLEDHVRERLDFLVNWMLHPGHQHFVRDPIRDASRLLIDWFGILCGLDPKQAPHPETVAISDQLLTLVIAKTDSSQQQSLIQHWNRFCEYKLDQAERAANLNRTKMQKLYIQQRSSVRQLTKKFRELKQLGK